MISRCPAETVASLIEPFATAENDMIDFMKCHAIQGTLWFAIVDFVDEHSTLRQSDTQCICLCHANLLCK